MWNPGFQDLPILQASSPFATLRYLSRQVRDAKYEDEPITMVITSELIKFFYQSTNLYTKQLSIPTMTKGIRSGVTSNTYYLLGKDLYTYSYSGNSYTTTVTLGLSNVADVVDIPGSTNFLVCAEKKDANKYYHIIFNDVLVQQSS
jgi:hypothetical protein